MHVTFEDARRGIKTRNRRVVEKYFESCVSDHPARHALYGLETVDECRWLLDIPAVADRAALRAMVVDAARRLAATVEDLHWVWKKSGDKADFERWNAACLERNRRGRRASGETGW